MNESDEFIQSLKSAVHDAVVTGFEDAMANISHEEAKTDTSESDGLEGLRRELIDLQEQVEELSTDSLVDEDEVRGYQ